MRIIVICLFLLPAFAADSNTTDQNGTAYDPGAPGPGLTVLDFAASWCKPCWKALPHVQQLSKDKPGLRVLVVSQDEQRAGADKLVRKLGLKLPVIWDEGHQWARKYQPKGMPTTMVIDSTGKILYTHVGFDPNTWQEFLTHLDQLLASAAGRTGSAVSKEE